MSRRGRLIAGVVGLLVLLVAGWLILRPAHRPEPRPQPPAVGPVADSTAAPREPGAKAGQGTSPAETAEIEEVRTCLRAFVEDPELVGADSLLDPLQPGYVKYLGSRTLVTRALALAGRSPAMRAEAIRAISEAYNVYLTKLPLEQGLEGSPWRPSVSYPGGVPAYLCVLRQLDAVETLPLLVQVFEKDQAVRREHYAKLGGPPASAQVGIMSYHGTLLAYASDHFLQEYRKRGDLLKTCTPAQRAVLDRYERYWVDLRRQVAEGLVGEDVTTVEVQQLQVMKYATDFCQAAGGAAAT